MRYRVILLSVFSFLGVIFCGQFIFETGAQSNGEPFEIDFDTLRLQRPLIDDDGAKLVFSSLAKRISHVFYRWDEDEFYDKGLLSELVEFISNHRSDEAALTAKLYLAMYLVVSKNKFERDSMIHHVIEEDVAKLFKSLWTEFPNSWQGKYASIFHPQNTFEYDDETELRIAEQRHILPIFLELEEHPEFITFLKDIGIRDPAGAYVREQIINLELERGNLENAEAELSIIKSRYPDAPITGQLKRRIHSVYESQFDGDFSSRPPEELLYILKTSQDTIKIQYAAAGLGNRDIWETLDMGNSFLEAVNEVVLAYIDRAVMGDSSEQDEMRDLMYRLWNLSVPMLLQMLNHENAARVEFSGVCLLYMRNEKIISSIIEKAYSAEDDEKKAELIGILSRMNEPCVPVMRFRECLDDTTLEELYQRLVVPALEELQTEEPPPTP